MAKLIKGGLPHDTRFRDLTGRQFGDLAVVAYIGYSRPRSNRKAHYWACRCRCGRTTRVLGKNLVNGNCRSCGCRRREVAKALFTRHGLTRTPTHKIWLAMRARCGRGGDPRYSTVVICARWQVFENFLADMGERPSPQHTLERRDSTLGYSPDNCRWATPKEQNRNKRNNVRITFNGRTMCIADWAEHLGLSYACLHNRLQRWSVERALTTLTGRGRQFCDRH